jgi:coenzyme F420 hydrogenase subunit beta
MNVSLTKKLGLCSGCGACTVVCPFNVIKLVRTAELNAPQIEEAACSDCQLCLTTCPGYDNYQRFPFETGDDIDESKQIIRKAFICHATDSTIRSESSSGGYVTALLMALLEENKISGVITLKPDVADPFEYSGAVIKDTDQLKCVQGSIYYPVSVCEGLSEVMKLEGQFAFVGKPCEVHAARLLSNNVKALNNKIYLYISIFCHHTPTRENNRAMIRGLNISPENIVKIKYRGRGWPGYFQVFGKNSKRIFCSSYRMIWDNYLSSGNPLPCKMCYDPYGQYADISVGDAWGFHDETGLGLSAVILRTDRGENFHSIVQQFNHLNCSETTLQQIFIGQPSLQTKKANKNLMIKAYELHRKASLREILDFLLGRSPVLMDKIKAMYLLFKISSSSFFFTK